MKKSKVKSFKNTLKNTVIPAKQTIDNGNMGKIIETTLKNQGLPIDSKSQGPDISVDGYEVEIKTRKKGSTADVTVGNATVDYIATHDYNNSIIKGKLQTIRWVEYDENDPFIDKNSSIVKTDKVLDFDMKQIQSEIEHQYNSVRQEIVNNNDSYSINTRVGWWEKKTENSWAFRIPWTNWKKYISHNETGAGFNEMFSDESSNSN
jgi:hypothetical protein